MGWNSVKRIALLMNSMKRKASIIARRIFNIFKIPFTQWVHTAVCIKMINISTPVWTKLNISFLRWESQSTKTLNDLSAWIGSRAKNQILAWLNLPWYYCSSQLFSHLSCIEVASSVIQLDKNNFKICFQYSSCHSPGSFCKKLAFFSPMTPSLGFKFYCIRSAFHFH